jgi:hypothetical protein
MLPEKASWERAFQGSESGWEFAALERRMAHRRHSAKTSAGCRTAPLCPWDGFCCDASAEASDPAFVPVLALLPLLLAPADEELPLEEDPENTENEGSEKPPVIFDAIFFAHLAVNHVEASW